MHISDAGISVIWRYVEHLSSFIAIDVVVLNGNEESNALEQVAGLLDISDIDVSVENFIWE
ncbi:hypothetical protein BIV08_15085 [Pseudomonas sp. AF76]|uniref:hypothetical protein n=1 Tax=Pseudomonas sp. AF76 TaxID=554393 RepID=UPI000F46B7CC|nr:hypothetical protein [Pseudomonas sp. AF76]ROO41085.1 hypothetical protein BIV08_15085 [Pseudomonas sp. AF76]